MLLSLWRLIVESSRRINDYNKIQFTSRWQTLSSQNLGSKRWHSAREYIWGLGWTDPWRRTWTPWKIYYFQENSGSWKVNLCFLVSPTTGSNQQIIPFIFLHSCLSAHSSKSHGYSINNRLMSRTNIVFKILSKCLLIVFKWLYIEHRHITSAARMLTDIGLQILVLPKTKSF